MLSAICLFSLLVLASCRPEMDPYKLEYQADSHSRQETGDPGKRVEGSYTYNTPDGNTIKVTYYADDTGYHVESDALPVAPEVPQPVAPEVPQPVDVEPVQEEVRAAEPVKEEEEAVEVEQPVVVPHTPTFYSYNHLIPYHHPYAAYPYPSYPLPHFGRRFAYSVVY